MNTSMRRDGTLKLSHLRRRALLTPKPRTYTYRNPDAKPAPDSVSTYSLTKLLAWGTTKKAAK